MAPTKKKKYKPDTSLAFIDNRKVEGVIVKVPADKLAQQPWFRKLDDETKEVVQSETKGLSSDLVVSMHSRLSIGRRLAHIQDVLKPYNAFVKYARTLNMHASTVYRWIEGYKNAAGVMPPTVIDAAAARGVPLLGEDPKRPLGVFTQAAKQLPPPRDPSPEQAHKYVDELLAKRKQLKQQGGAKPEPEARAEVQVDPDEAAMEVYRVYRNRYRQLPHNSKTKRNFAQFVIGLIMAESGMGNQTSFGPVAIPDDFRAGPGRPRLVSNA